MLFWIVATLLALAVAVTLILPLLQGGTAETGPRTTEIYRDQLAEVDRDLARGILAPDEAERARTEIARRLLDADRRGTAPAREAPAGVNRLAVGGAAVLLVVGTVVLYERLGAPGYPDIPRTQRIADSEAVRANRIGQAEAEEMADIAPIPDSELPEATRTLIAQLREIVPQRPDDLQGWTLLSEHEARLGNYAAAARAQERVVAIKGDAATPADKAALADRMVSAAAGIISPETETLLRAILAEDEGNFAARYYLGLLYFQTDRPDVAYRFWRDLAESDTDAARVSPHVELARAGVEEAAFRAGLDYSLPERTGPTAADVAAMADLSPEDRAARIAGMVSQLSDRLATEGGTVEEWARLIRALVVQGDLEQAEAVWREALGVFSMSQESMDLLSQTAEDVGLSP